MMNFDRRGMDARFALLIAIAISVGVSPLSADDDLIPEDTCQVDLLLPPGATVTVDGRDIADARQFKYRNQRPGALVDSTIEIRFRGGETVARTVLTEGGRRFTLPVSLPGTERPELVPQTGHAEYVSAAAISPDGHWVLTGSSDKTVNLWDISTGRLLRTFQGHITGVHAVAFSPDGRQCVSGSYDGATIIWDVITGARLRTLALRAADDERVEINTLLYTLDGRFLITGGGRQSAATRAAYLAEKDPAKADAIRQRLAAELVVWNLSNGQPRRPFSGHKGKVISCARSPDGRFLLTGSADNSAKLWEIASGRNLKTFGGHRWDVLAVAFSPDGRQIVTTAGGRQYETKRAWSELILWDVQTEKRLHRRQIDSAIGSLAFVSDSKIVAASNSYRDGFSTEVAIWDLPELTESSTTMLPGISGAVLVDPKSAGVLVTKDRAVLFWDPVSGRTTHTFGGNLDSREYGTLFSPDGQVVAMPSKDKRQLVLWSLTSITPPRTLGIPAEDGEIARVAFSPDGQTLLVVGDIGDGTEAFAIWDCNELRRRSRFVYRGETTSPLAVSNGGRYICLRDAKAIVAKDTGVILYEAATGRRLHALRPQTRWGVAE